MLLSICIPSYNRGELAYKRVEELLPLCESSDELELIVSNNGSTENIEGYEKIAKLNSTKLFYHEFSENQFFHGNLRQVIKMAHGDFCLLISDEDTVVTDNLDFYLNLLKNHANNLAFVKGATSNSYMFQENEVFNGGEEAISGFFLMGNYMSGVIYNRHILTNEVVDLFYERYKDLASYYYYPHLMYDGYVLLHGFSMLCCVPLIIEGDPDRLHPTEEEIQSTKVTVASYNSVEARLEQMIGYIVLIGDLNIKSSAFKCEMILMVLTKTWYLISIVKTSYTDSGYDWRQIQLEVKQAMKEAICNLGLQRIIEVYDKEAIDQYMDCIMKYIDDLA